MNLTTHEGVYRWSAPLATGEKVQRYTAYIRYEDTLEEIDVDATSTDEAWRIAEAAMTRDYEPAGRIVNVEQRFGCYW